MNRTVVELVTAKPVSRAELADLGLHLVLQRLQPRELVHPPGQPFEIRDDQCAQRGIALRCGDPGVAVHVVGHGDRNILHSFTVTRFTWPAPRVARPASVKFTPVPGSKGVMPEDLASHVAMVSLNTRGIAPIESHLAGVALTRPGKAGGG